VSPFSFFVCAFGAVNHHEAPKTSRLVARFTTSPGASPEAAYVRRRLELAVGVSRGAVFHWLNPVITGVLLGAANSLSSGLGSPYGPVAVAPLQGIRVLEFVAAWLGTAWAWALLAFAIGWLTDRLGSAVAGAVVGLISAVLTYYLTDSLLGVNSSLSTTEIEFWSLVALVVGPVMGAAGWAAHRGRGGASSPGCLHPH